MKNVVSKTRTRRTKRADNTRSLVCDGHGGWRLRVWRRAAQGKVCPRILVKCGCCEQSLQIYADPTDGFIEINGVHASLEEWARVLLPLLRTR